MSTNPSILREERLYLVLATLFCVIVIVSNLLTTKIFHVPLTSNLALPIGLITYPLTFTLSDLVTEIFGEKKARFMIYLGFAMSFMTFLFVQLALALPAHPHCISPNNPFGYTDLSDYENAYRSVFSSNGLVLSASLIAYSLGQILDIRLFSYIKVITDSRYLWIRNVGSTLISQVIDTIVVLFLIFYWGFGLPFYVVAEMALWCYVYKIFFTLFNIPLFYAAVSISNKILNHKKTFSFVHTN